MAKKLIYVLLFQLMIYIMLFIISPRLFSLHPSDSSSSFIIISLTATVISLIGIIFFVDQIRYWSIGIPVLWGLIMLYHPQNIYGIGYNSGIGISFYFPVPWVAMSIALYVFAIQCFICIGKLIIRKLF